MCLQVIADRADKTAKSTTKEEFIDQFRCIKHLAEQQIPEPLYSFDNISTQKYADMADLGITEEQRLPLGPNMPDAHQIVEHCFSQFKPWFIQQVYSTAGPADESPQMQQLLKEQWQKFGQHYQKEGGLKKNADSLPVTLECIAMPQVQFVSLVDDKVRVGTNGGWVPNQLS